MTCWKRFHKRKGRAGEIERRVGERLIVAIQRDARQRRQIVPVIRKEHAFARGHGGLKSGARREREVARACATGIAIGIGEMHRTLPELLFDTVGASHHLFHGLMLGQFGDGEMVLGMGADGDERI